MDNSTSVSEKPEVPAWLNAEFLSDILSKEENKDILVTDFDTKAAVAKGDNYLSTLYRIVANYKEINRDDLTKKYYLIVKTLPVGEVLQKILLEMNGYEKEFYMYKTVLPAMYSIIKSAVGKIHPLSARCLPCQREHTIVLEDLQHLGYKMANRLQGVDLDHCKLTVRALARLHTASLALLNRDSSFVDMYSEGMYTFSSEDRQKSLEYHFESNLNTLATNIEKWAGFEHYAERVRKLIPTALDKMIEIVAPKENSLNVLNHGDCWLNNMLFRYSSETGKVEDVRFIDFQIARFSSPALDLQYFIVSSPTNEVRFEHREILLEEYYKEFSDSMKVLNMGSQLITFQQFKEEFEEKDIFGLLTACTILSTFVADKSDVPDLSDIKEDHMENGENLMKKTFAGKRFREIFQKMLVYYDKRGLL